MKAGLAQWNSRSTTTTAPAYEATPMRTPYWVGVSRSGKTPTCVYLAMQFGIRTANYPLTDGSPVRARRFRSTCSTTAHGCSGSPSIRSGCRRSAPSGGRARHMRHRPAAAPRFGRQRRCSNVTGSRASIRVPRRSRRLPHGCCCVRDCAGTRTEAGPTVLTWTDSTPGRSGRRPSSDSRAHFPRRPVSSSPSAAERTRSRYSMPSLACGSVPPVCVCVSSTSITTCTSESAGWAHQCKEVCRRLSIDLTVLDADLKANVVGHSDEGAARTARYEAFERILSHTMSCALHTPKTTMSRPSC